VVSSQGDASFAVFDRESWEFLGSFAIGATDTIDGVEESDGLDIFPAALGGSFPNGLLVTQDGSNEPAAVFGDPEDGEIQNFNVNFKLSDLADVVARLDVPAPDATFDPRALVRSGTPDEDVIRASTSGPEILLGASGNDRLLGGDGIAVLRGGDGRDTMQAGAGGARLAGGEDRDVLIGGGGPDTFVLDGAGPDDVRDFDPAFDVVEIAIAGVRDIALREVGTNQILAVDDGSGFEDVATIRGGGVAPDAVVDPFVG
jgi:Ca2+-binding RTX toxin-like protein